MKDWSCSVEFTLRRDSPNQEADSHEDYLQALMRTVGELDAVLKPYGIAREIYACQVAELSCSH